MTEPIIVTKKEFIEYIHSKPKDTPVIMSECLYEHECGCVMAQYAKDRDVEFDCCFNNYWGNNQSMRFEDEVSLDDFVDWDKDMKTFGDLQQLNPTEIHMLETHNNLTLQKTRYHHKVEVIDEGGAKYQKGIYNGLENG